MSNISYEAPRGDRPEDGGASRQDKLRRVALLQKGLIAALVTYLPAIGGGMVLFWHPGSLALDGLLVLTLVWLGSLVLGAVCAVSLAVEVYGVWRGILICLWMLVPIFGLLFVLLVNSQVTKMLRDHGIRVGYWGARMSQL